MDAIWIAPFFKSPMADFGYDVADYRSVDPLFGTTEDFDRLLARAHALGLKVMIDQVVSHTSVEHPWFKASRQSRDNPQADWYVWAAAKEDGTSPNNWLSIFGGVAWRWEPRRRQYYLHNFLSSQPDLNFTTRRCAGRCWTRRDEKREKALQEMLKVLPGTLRDLRELYALLTELMERKRSLFPNVTRMIVEHKVTDQGDTFHIAIASTMEKKGAQK